MDSFFKEIAGLTELPFDTAFSSYRYVNMGGAALYVQGHKGIILFDTAKIVLRVAKARLEILGSNLKIKQLSSDDIMITGEVLSVCLQN